MGYPAYKCPNCAHHEMADPLALQKAFRGPYICKECNWDTRVPIPAGIVTTQQQKDQVQAEQMGEAISYTIKSMMDLIITLMNIFRWIIKNKDVKRTSVHTMPSASPCTATEEAVSNRGGVEPLPLCKYVHGKHKG